MVTEIDIIVKKIRAITDWYKETSRITHTDNTVSIEKAEELIKELEGVEKG